MTLHERFPQLPRRFRRHELRNLCRRKGYRLVREYRRGVGTRPGRGSYILRIERLPWPSMRGRHKEYEYCNTEAATASQRLWLHLQRKPNVTYHTSHPWPKNPAPAPTTSAT